MAIMIPSVISPDIRSNAERNIFRWFKEAHETEDWIVLHSLGIANHRKVIHGEVDFFVIAPNLGIFALEVKGGRVKRTGGMWSFTDKYGHTDTKNRSPFDQAWEGIYSIKDSIAEHVDDQHKHLKSIIFGIGVMFPDIEYSSVGADEASWQVFDYRDGNNVQAFLKRIAIGAEARWTAVRGAPDTQNYPTKEDALYLLSVLRGDFDFVPPLSLQIKHAHEDLIKLTKEQYRCIDQLDENPRCLIKGAAGTGKTLLAVEEAKKAVANGERTAVFCYNQLLGKWLSDYFQNQPSSVCPAYVGTIHKYMSEVLKKQRVPLGNVKKDDRYYETLLPGFATEILRITGADFDRIIIDEAQDIIKPTYLSLLDTCLSNGLSKGKWMMFGDLCMQSIFSPTGSEEGFIELLEERSSFIRYRLSINCRNTHCICEEIKTVTGVDSLNTRIKEIDGPPVQYVTYKDAREEKEKIEEVLKVLADNHIQLGDITILSPRRRENSIVNRFNGIEIENYGLPKTEKITFSTIHSFKGLENKVIILTDIENLFDKKLMYVGLSRATTLLYVIETEEANKQYTELFIKRRLHND